MTVTRCVIFVTVLAVAAACGGETRGDPAPRDTALQRMAEEAVPRVERAAGLEFIRPPRVARSPGEKVTAYVRRELDDQLPEERARGVGRAYARLGLLPDTVELRSLLESLYLSQIVGFYAPRADTLFVREDVGGRTLEPVLVHELVHALQDQHMDLDSLLAARRSSNDAATAAQAALEGHATYVMLEDALERRSGRDVDLGAVDLAGLLRGVDLSSLGGAPELAGAPRVIRESLLFPYTGGLTFVQEVWRSSDGRPAPLGDDMPGSTEQVLHPDRFMSAGRDRPTAVEFPRPPGEAWTEVHADGLGEFEIRLLLETFLADSVRARAAAAGWDGDRYRLLETPAGGEVLVWATVWDSPADASEFADAADEALRARYARSDGDDGSARDRGDTAPADEEGARPAGRSAGDGGGARRILRVERVGLGGRPAVMISDAPPGRTGPLPEWATDVELETPPPR